MGLKNPLLLKKKRDFLSGFSKVGFIEKYGLIFTYLDRSIGWGDLFPVDNMCLLILSISLRLKPDPSFLSLLVTTTASGRDTIAGTHLIIMTLNDAYYTTSS